MPTIVLLWILLCAYLNCAGWILSALHQLNAFGYTLASLIGLAALFFWRREIWVGHFFPRIRARRFRRMFPLAFLILAGLIFLGGVLHAPSNYDALAYRIPRVLHWLAEGQWHWIHTDFPRLNTRAVGYEWVAAPMFLFTHSHRLVFLIGVASFLLLPGLVFSVFTRLGVRPRVAGHWMWIAPTGYCFALQAGGIGNDIFGATLALAAFDLALRARRSDRFRDVAVACIAAGLVTGAKTSNIPLLFPCAVALFPCWRILLSRPVLTVWVVIVASLSSFLPTAILNTKYCGDWSGAKAESIALRSGSPLVSIPGNVMILMVQNFAPPVFPIANRWNAIAPKLLPAKFHQRMEETFEASGANLALPELQNEEFSGLGFGVSSLLMISLLAGLGSSRHQKPRKTPEDRGTKWLRAAPFISALGYCAKSGIGVASRIFTPYYLLLFPGFLSHRTQSNICRRKWWCLYAVGVFGLAMFLVIITPSRPLWPAQTVLSSLLKSHPDNQMLKRGLTVYSVYSVRADGLAPVRELLPANARTVGLVTFDDLETSLWLPFGRRRFIHVVPGDTREQLLQQGIEYVVLNGEWFPGREGMTVEQWVERFGATIEATVPLRLRAGRETFNWYIARLR